MNNYDRFLQTKQMSFQNSGFDIDKNTLNSNLYDWQKDIVRWALKKGKSALFEDCGLGKTIQQLEWGYRVSEQTKMPVLILAPLAVADQTQREGARFEIDVNICRGQSDVRPGINISNYEIMEKFDRIRFQASCWTKAVF
jgi:SNF2 family DNA or RNA helicase